MNESKRTDQQRKAIEVFSRELASELNSKGQYMQIVLEKMKTGSEVQWTQAACKELWKTMQKAIVGTTSTTELTPAQVSDIHQTLMNWLINHLEVVDDNGNKSSIDYIDFPSNR